MSTAGSRWGRKPRQVQAIVSVLFARPGRKRRWRTEPSVVVRAFLGHVGVKELREKIEPEHTCWTLAIREREQNESRNDRRGCPSARGNVNTNVGILIWHASCLSPARGTARSSTPKSVSAGRSRTRTWRNRCAPPRTIVVDSWRLKVKRTSGQQSRKILPAN